MRIGDEEAVVVVELMRKAAVAALAVLVQQRDHHCQRGPGRRRALQAQAQQAHAGEAAFLAYGSLVNTASLPMATPCSLTPISAPQMVKGLASATA